MIYVRRHKTRFRLVSFPRINKGVAYTHDRWSNVCDGLWKREESSPVRNRRKNADEQLKELENVFGNNDCSRRNARQTHSGQKSARMMTMEVVIDSVKSSNRHNEKQTHA